MAQSPFERLGDRLGAELEALGERVDVEDMGFAFLADGDDVVAAQGAVGGVVPQVGLSLNGDFAGSLFGPGHGRAFQLGWADGSGLTGKRRPAASPVAVRGCSCRLGRLLQSPEYFPGNR